MSTDIDYLLISFLLGTKEKLFQLHIRSYQKLEVVGRIIGYTYNLEVDFQSLEFYAFVRNRYGVIEKNFPKDEKLIDLTKCLIEQKRGKPGFPWQHLLTVSENERLEKIIFHPEVCQRENENEEEDEEYKEEEKRADLIKSSVTTLPEEYRDTNIGEKPLDKLIRLTEEADLYKYGQNYQE